MVFPLPVGQLVDDQILASIGRADRWRDVVIDPTALYPVTDDVMIFSYRAWAERSSAAPYACHATSVYRLGDSAWLLAFHQQTQLEYVTQPKADTRALVEIDGRRCSLALVDCAPQGPSAGSGADPLGRDRDHGPDGVAP